MYKNVVEALFINRPNRFLANVNLNGKEVLVHVKNTGRCKELLLPGVQVYLEPANSERKTPFSLIGVKKGEILVNIDSQVPNKVVENAINDGKLILPGCETITKLQREKTYGKSRFDFYFETGTKRGFIEVKGVTLEVDGIARFPDAPTERGSKHLSELIKATKEGFTCFVIFVIQLKGCTKMEPNNETDPLFSKTLIEAQHNGVGILAFDCHVNVDSIKMDEMIPINFY